MAQFDLSDGDDGVAVLRLSGEIDLAVVDELLEAAQQGLAHADGLLLDLAEVTFVDSTGLGALVRLRNEAETAGKELSLTEVPRSLRRLLEITGLQDVFTIAPSDGTTEQP